MSSHFAALDALDFPVFEPGTVWLVGAGPGAPGLISLLGYHALAEAEIIVYDALVSETLLKLANPAAERIYAGKRGGKPSEKQADITDRLIDYARAGKRVLRLKGGDPFMFGRGAEECFALVAHGIRYRIVPGITAGIGGLAYAGIPVTWRDTNQSVTFLTGHDETGNIPGAVDWAAVAHAPVIVMYMAVKHLRSIAEKLLAAGRSPSDPVAVVIYATLPSQHVVHGTLGGIAEIESLLVPPAIVVLGPIGPLRADLDWFTGSLTENSLG